MPIDSLLMAVSPKSEQRVRWSSSVAILGALSVALLAVGCAGPTQLSDEEVARAERILLRPFERAEIVVCDQLEIEMTPNFYGNRVGQEEIDRASTQGDTSWRQQGVAVPADHDLNIKKRELEGGGTMWTYTNLHSRQPMSFRVGAVEFEVIRRATVKVLGGRVDARLMAKAGGQGGVTIIDPNGGDPRQMPAWRRGQLLGEIDTRAAPIR